VRLAGNKFHSDTIHAVAFASGLWAIIKDVTQMATATMAMNLNPRHEGRFISGCADCAVDRSVEAGPPGTTVKFSIGSE